MYEIFFSITLIFMFILSNLLNYGTYVILGIILILITINVVIYHNRDPTNLEARDKIMSLSIIFLTYFIFMSLIISITQIYNNNFISQSTILYNKRTGYLGYILLFLITLIIFMIDRDNRQIIIDIFDIKTRYNQMDSNIFYTFIYLLVLIIFLISPMLFLVKKINLFGESIYCDLNDIKQQFVCRPIK